MPSVRVAANLFICATSGLLHCSINIIFYFAKYKKGLLLFVSLQGLRPG